jgi:hypothetical protein
MTFLHIPILLLGTFFYRADVTEKVNFEGDGTGNAAIVVNIRDLREEVSGLLHCRPFYMNRILDSMSHNFSRAVPDDKDISTVKAVFDSVKHTFTYSCNFNDLPGLNRFLSMISGEEEGSHTYYIATEKTVTRLETPVMTDGKAGRENTVPKGQYHVYRVLVGLPPGIKKVKEDSDYAYIENNGETIEIEIDMAKLQSGASLLTHVNFKKF